MTKITIPDTADLLKRLRSGIDPSTQMRLGGKNHDGRSLEAADRIEALERALDAIIMEATSRNHAIDIARRARAEGGE